MHAIPAMVCFNVQSHGSGSVADSSSGLLAPLLIEHGGVLSCDTASCRGDATPGNPKPTTMIFWRAFLRRVWQPIQLSWAPARASLCSHWSMRTALRRPRVWQAAADGVTTPAGVARPSARGRRSASVLPSPAPHSCSSTSCLRCNAYTAKLIILLDGAGRRCACDVKYGAQPGPVRLQPLGCLRRGASR